MRNIVGSISKIDGTPASNVKIKFVLVDANGTPISSFNIGGENVRGQKTVTTNADGNLYIKTGITSDWVEKYIGGDYYISQIMAYNNKYFITYQNNSGIYILTFTTDFVSFDTLDGINQIINYYNNNVMVYNVTTDKMKIIYTKPMVTNIVPTHTYIYAGIKNENSIL